MRPVALSVVLALTAFAASPGRAADEDPGRARLRRLWEGGTWNSDIAPGGGWLSGYRSRREWTDPGVTPPNALPLTAAARARDQALRRAAAAGQAPPDPRAACHPPGLPYLLARDPNGGFRAVVGSGELDFLYGSQDYRRIFLDRRFAPDSTAAQRDAAAAERSAYKTLSYNGTSLGWWEGPTFVIQTVRIRGERTEFEPFVPKPEGTEVVERYTPVGPGRIDAAVTVTSPAFTRPWRFGFRLTRDPHGRPVEALCTDNDQYKLGG